MHSLVIALTVFALIVPAELPDKTMVATLVLATKFRAGPVMIGSAAGFIVQAGIAVGAGSAVALLPSRPVHAVSAAIFALGAVLMLRPTETATEEQQEIEAEIAEVPAEPSTLRVILTSFLVLFVAEWGDLTQLLTASLSAKYHAAIPVFLGSSVGLITVAAVGVTFGKAMLRVVPMHWVRRIAAAAFGVVAVVTAVQAAGAV